MRKHPSVDFRAAYIHMEVSSPSNLVPRPQHIWDLALFLDHTLYFVLRQLINWLKSRRESRSQVLEGFWIDSTRLGLPNKFLSRYELVVVHSTQFHCPNF